MTISDAIFLGVFSYLVVAVAMAMRQWEDDYLARVYGELVWREFEDAVNSAMLDHKRKLLAWLLHGSHLPNGAGAVSSETARSWREEINRPAASRSDPRSP